jgi:hypothetical protein
MDFTWNAEISALGLFTGMLLFCEIGRRIGMAKLARDPGGLAKGIGAAEGVVFGLLGLLVAFTFSGAASRFEDRRHLISQEANAIGTAYLRLDLLVAKDQPELRQLFRRYIEVRATVYQDMQDETKTQAHLAEGNALQAGIWSKALSASRSPEAAPQAAMLLLPALNDMIDMTTTRATATKNHPPLVVYGLLVALGLIGALLVGYSMSENTGRSWLHVMAFSAIMSLTVYVIIDLEYPRMGLIRIGSADQILLDLRKGM